MLINIKLFKNYVFFLILVFYTKLTHLIQKLKKLRLDGTCGTKLDSN